MQTKRKNLAIRCIALFICCFTAISSFAQGSEADDKTLSPYFFVKSDDANLDQMPLKSTVVKVNIAGIIADVLVNQEYKNEGKNPIEAIYVFPASTRASVHHMRMKIGERTIEAIVKERGAARQEYETAVKEGKSASLLEQQRPNVFQMNVGNIMPGDIVNVEMEYTELLIPESGEYSFVFPTVVGPRYSNKPAITSTSDERWVANPYLSEGVQPPNTFSIECNITAGMPISEIKSSSHEVNVKFQGPDKANIALKENGKYQGTKDFILNYRLCGNAVETGILLYKGKTENFFLALIQPPKRVTTSMIPPREYVFILDVSGSMSGYPLEISKKLAMDIISQLRAEDMFNILLFAGGSEVLSEQSLLATPDNISKARQFITKQQGGGGTELLPALQRALSLQNSENVSRTFIIATDGYVTVEKEAFDFIRNNLNKANFFAFGIGTAVNRYLIEGIAHSGMGSPFIVTKQDEATATANSFISYIKNPVLTDISIKYENFDVYDIEPRSIPDVFAERPVIIFGKYKGTPTGSIIVSGQTGGEDYKERVDLASLTSLPENSALKYLWAREKIRFLDDFGSSLNAADQKQVQEEVTRLGLKYNLLTKYTSFVATDNEIRNKTGSTTTVTQPLPLPSGVSNLAIGGSGQNMRSTGNLNSPGRVRSEAAVYKNENKTQEKENSSPGSIAKKDEQIYTTVTDMPAYPGGDEAMKKFILNNLKYPDKARKAGISGKVYVSFTVKADGTLTNIRILRGIGGGCDEEALRIIRQMPKWKPGKQGNSNVNCEMTLPIFFQLVTKQG